MDKEALLKLEKLNQLQLTDDQKDDVLNFLDARYSQFEKLNTIDTGSVEPMVHVLPIFTVVREDITYQNFTREQLQENAPETMDGYWQVPRLVE